MWEFRVFRCSGLRSLGFFGSGRVGPRVSDFRIRGSFHWQEALAGFLELEFRAWGLGLRV